MLLHALHMLPQDVAMVCQRVRAAAVVYDSAEGRALSPSRTRSPSPRKEGSLPNSPKREAASDGPTVSFHVVTQVRTSGPPCGHVWCCCLPVCLPACRFVCYPLCSEQLPVF